MNISKGLSVYLAVQTVLGLPWMTTRFDFPNDPENN